MRILLTVSVAALLACTPQEAKLGGFTLPANTGAFSVREGTTVLLDSFEDGASQYAPVAVRANARARIEAQYGSFKFTELPGAWVEGRKFEWTEVKNLAAKGAWKDTTGKPVVTVEAGSTGPGELVLTYTAVDPTVNRLSLAFSCRPDDHFLGFGAQADGLDHRGHTVPIWTSEPGIGKQLENDDYPEVWMLVGTRHASSYGLPTWLSNRGFIGVVDTDRKSVFELCSVDERAFRVEVWGNTFTLWLFRGGVDSSGLKESPLTQATARVLGRPMRPPPIAFAPWNDAIFGSANVRAVAKTLRDNGIPSSVIWTEDFRGGQDTPGGYRLVEDWDLDPTLYPDATALAAELKAQGFSWLAYFNPFIVDGARVFDEATQGGHFVKKGDGTPYLFNGPTFKPTGLVDLSSAEAREWVRTHMRKALDLGFTGWMADYGEWLPHDAVLASGEDPLEAHNRYARIWALLTYDVLLERAADGEQRVSFSRSGWLRSNMVTPVVWAGDQRTSFQRDDGLPTVVPLALGLGLGGASTFGSDIGGYQSATNPPATKELFFRWTELGALSPVMRTHHGTLPHQQWRFDSDAQTLAHYRRWARFHMQLFPYLDAHAAEAEERGVPIMRALPLMFPDDEAAWTLSDEYLLGGAMLVAPVVEEGATSRTVHVPTGDWVSLSEDLLVHGPADYVAQAPLGEIPLLVRAGAVIPRLPERTQTLLPAAGTDDWAAVKDERSLLVVTGGTGGFTERDGTYYGVAQTAGTRYAVDDTELADCASAAERGCVDRTGPRVIVRMKTFGRLDVPGHLVIVDGPARAYDVELFTPTKVHAP